MMGLEHKWLSWGEGVLEKKKKKRDEIFGSEILEIFPAHSFLLVDSVFSPSSSASFAPVFAPCPNPLAILTWFTRIVGTLEL